jgi:hypothetical protein
MAVWLVLLAGCGGGEPQTTTDGVAPLDSSKVTLAVPSRLDVAQAQAELADLALEQVAFDPVEANPDRDRATQGRAPAKHPEPAEPLDRTSPSALLDDALGALKRGDVSALARLSRARGAHPQLTEDDAADAKRRFLSPAGTRYWGRIGEAAERGQVQIQTDGAEALILVEVGGAAGTYRLRMTLLEDGWYFAG